MIALPDRVGREFRREIPCQERRVRSKQQAKELLVVWNNYSASMPASTSRPVCR